MRALGHDLRRAGCGLLAALLLAGSASAADVTVIEGETARFAITVQPKFHTRSDGRAMPIRVWYDTDGGTAIEGTDYATAHSWSHHVRGTAGAPLTIAVKTFADDAVEGDETFNIRVRKLQVLTRGRWGHTGWRDVPASRWTVAGPTTATITDATRVSQVPLCVERDPRFRC